MPVETIPCVSIGMPVRNGERFLEGALASLRSQKLRDFELIISDNASTDGTEDLCRAAAVADPRITYIRQPEQIPLQQNFNFVLSQARAPLFVWAADDDRWYPEFLQRLVEAMNRNPSAVLAFCKWENLRSDGSVTTAFQPVDWSSIFRARKADQFAQLALIDGGSTQKGNHVYGLMRTSVLRKVGGMPTSPVSRGGGEDIHLLLRLLCEGDFEIVNELLFQYRIKSLPPRPRRELLRYLIDRVFGSRAGHGGNLLTAVRGKHSDHVARRKIIWREAPLSVYRRAAIWLRLVLAELRMMLVTLPKDAINQLRSTAS